MYFAPFIVRAEHERKVPVVIERATAEDLKATAKAPKWQTDWTSEYLADEKIEKYSLKTKEGNLIALGAYRVMGRKAYVYILYLESAPASNPTLTAKREYYGIGEVMIAFGIKFSIDSGCRGDVLFEAKFLFVHLVMCLAADKGAFCNPFRLGRMIGTFQTVYFYGRFYASKSNSRIFTTDFHHLADACLSFDFYIFSYCNRHYFRGT